ncbi:hypothetical protein, partial [Streptomyces laculatispora]|uniref:hypothetical protein n=1 Tax=Streptomyces laculatispora TaxID=887464 RepID=UPI001A941298
MEGGPGYLGAAGTQHGCASLVGELVRLQSRVKDRPGARLIVNGTERNQLMELEAAGRLSIESGGRMQEHRNLGPS